MTAPEYHFPPEDCAPALDAECVRAAAQALCEASALHPNGFSDREIWSEALMQKWREDAMRIATPVIEAYLRACPVPYGTAERRT